MKPLLAFLILSISSAKSETIVSQVCRAQCLGVDVSSHSLRFLGEIQAAKPTKLNAWRELSTLCKKRAGRAGVDSALATGSVFFDSDQSSNSSYSSSSRFERISTFYYSYVSRSSSSHSTYHQTDKLRLEIEFANATTACGPEEVYEEDFIPYYEGDLPVRG